MSGTDKLDVAIEFPATPEEDLKAKRFLDPQLSDYREEELEEYDWENQSMYKTVVIRPIKYSLPVSLPPKKFDPHYKPIMTFNCTGFVHYVAWMAFNDFLGSAEHVTIKNTTKIMMNYKLKTIKPIDCWAYTPNQLLKEAVKRGGRILKGKNIMGLGHKPFIDSVTDSYIKDSTPNE